MKRRWPVNERRCYFSLRVSPFEVAQLALHFVNLRLFVDQRDREKVRDSCVGTAARRKAQLGILAWSERLTGGLWRNKAERDREEKGEREREDYRGAERFKTGVT